jgi:hypothetical protein
MSFPITLELSYTPADFFEEPYEYSQANYTVQIGNGRVVASFASEQSDSVYREVQKEVESRFLGAQLNRDKPFHLSGYTSTQMRPDGTAAIGVSMSETLHLDASLDVVHRNAAGNVIFDSKADRIRESKQFAQLASKHRNDAVAASLLESYNAAIEDPPNRLTHLYEIRDALSKKFGGEAEARAVLGITTSAWSRLGRLANNVPLSEGRHRGKNVGQLRDATSSELGEARDIARGMIRAYLNCLS